ncbi:hypothetical protein P4S64_09520 [Vibrio sp. M60_M31a]
MAPELEFFLVKKNLDWDYPLEPPIGRNGRPETARQSFSIDAVNEFDPIFEDMYDFCEAQGLDVDTLVHESGAAQMELNFDHGEPLDLADQVFLFKRTVREAALRHDVYATFMAKPMEHEPGSAMHIHQSLVDVNGKNLFANEDGSNSELFLNYIAGMQKIYPGCDCLFCAKRQFLPSTGLRRSQRLPTWLGEKTTARLGFEFRSLIKMPAGLKTVTPVRMRTLT